MDEQGNQTLRVEPGTGASTGAGLDAGTDQRQTNHQGDAQTTGDQNESDYDVGVAAGGTAIDGGNQGNESGYGAGEPTNFAGGTTSSGAGSGVDFAKTNQPDNNTTTRGAADFGEVRRDDPPNAPKH